MRIRKKKRGEAQVIHDVRATAIIIKCHLDSRKKKYELRHD